MDGEYNDSWAEVELWRWQYGELPSQDDIRKLDISVGVNNMAKALESGDRKKMPSVYNVISVLKYLAKKVK
jgi:hypothetical protein